MLLQQLLLQPLGMVQVTLAAAPLPVPPHPGIPSRVGACLAVLIRCPPYQLGFSQTPPCTRAIAGAQPPPPSVLLLPAPSRLPHLSQHYVWLCVRSLALHHSQHWHHVYFLLGYALHCTLPIRPHDT